MANPNHDDKGRFSSGSSGMGPSGKEMREAANKRVFAGIKQSLKEAGFNKSHPGMGPAGDKVSRSSDTRADQPATTRVAELVAQYERGQFASGTGSPLTGEAARRMAEGVARAEQDTRSFSEIIKAGMPAKTGTFKRRTGKGPRRYR